MKEFYLFFIVFCIFLLIVHIKSVKDFENFASSDPNELIQKADECGKSIQDITNVLEAQKQEDIKAFNDATNIWRTKKYNIQNAFKSNLSSWASACRGGACFPPLSFYTKIPNVDHSYYDFKDFDSDLNTCAQTCLENDACKWFLHNGSHCWIKGNNNELGWVSSFKTNSGLKTYQNFHGYNDDYWDGGPMSFADCQNKCKNESKCNMVTYNTNSSHCWTKSFHQYNGDTYIKEAEAPYIFPDNHAFIQSQIGPAPVMKRTEIRIGDIVCQNCQSSQKNLLVSDSKQVNMDQLNICVANLKEAAAQAAQHNKDAETLSQDVKKNDTVDNSSSSPSSSTQAVPPTPSDNKKMYIGMGVVSGVCTLIIAAIIIFFVFKNKATESE